MELDDGTDLIITDVFETKILEGTGNQVNAKTKKHPIVLDTNKIYVYLRRSVN